jgi:hypothetical protein
MDIQPCGILYRERSRADLIAALREHAVDGDSRGSASSWTAESL